MFGPLINQQFLLLFPSFSTSPSPSACVLFLFTIFSVFSSTLFSFLLFSVQHLIHYLSSFQEFKQVLRVFPFILPLLCFISFFSSLHYFNIFSKGKRAGWMRGGLHYFTCLRPYAIVCIFSTTTQKSWLTLSLSGFLFFFIPSLCHYFSIHFPLSQFSSKRNSPSIFLTLGIFPVPSCFPLPFLFDGMIFHHIPSIHRVCVRLNAHYHLSNEITHQVTSKASTPRRHTFVGLDDCWPSLLCLWTLSCQKTSKWSITQDCSTLCLRITQTLVPTI